jgi:hypothetical protein
MARPLTTPTASDWSRRSSSASRLPFTRCRLSIRWTAAGTSPSSPRGPRLAWPCLARSLKHRPQLPHNGASRLNRRGAGAMNRDGSRRQADAGCAPALVVASTSVDPSGPTSPARLPRRDLLLAVGSALSGMAAASALSHRCRLGSRLPDLRPDVPRAAPVRGLNTAEGAARCDPPGGAAGGRSKRRDASPNV